ncbi:MULTISPECIES: DMT family transporter [Tritonibacter]|uniref:DMT family transporter n=1 Tax=Tritonibacter TaxID=2083206 RepID=UPI000806BD10|nr:MULTISPECIES: DMT family transporter [Tritonibacter]MCA2008970.1 DMT family transporter [Tritonibacter mobilis]GLP86705.1 membrane protein [Tritonibacter mobilis]SDX63213.1 Permease of the drug/metabolite transporter (DMT) superfamily [Tritonibacter mobilis]
MDNVKGIVLLLIAMVGFTIEDLFIKQLSGSLAVGQILLFIGLGAGVVFFVALRLQKQSLWSRDAWQPMPVLRALAEGGAAMSFATALALVDISVVAAVFQATPLAITMGAALFLGEQVGWRRWSAIFVGFIGVLIIIRPGLAGFEPNALLVLVSVLCVAARDLMTRRMPASIPSSVVSVQAYLAVVVAGGAMLLLTPQTMVAPTSFEWGMLAGGTIFGVVAYYGIVTATRIADAAVITPFRYSRLVFSMIGGAIVFSERPDAMTLLGSALIIATGLYTFVRERRLARRAARMAVQPA